MEWINAHWNDVLAIIAAVIGLATAIVKITPTQKDDNVLAKVIKVLSVFSLCKIGRASCRERV